MSMNFSEFKKLIGAEPLSKDPEILRARQSNPEFEQAAADAEVFEHKLDKALELAVPGDAFLEEIISISKRDAAGPRWYAIAASVLILVGVSGVSWWQLQQPSTIEEYVSKHFGHDGQKVLGLASADFDAAIIGEIMSKLDLKAEDQLADRIRFVKFCPTMEGRGAHMVVQTDDGPVTVIYMPGTAVKDRHIIEFGEMQAYLVAMEAGSAAIIGRQDQAVSSIDSLVRESLLHTI